MSSPALGLTMLALIVVAIMMGFPTAFTLMGLGMLFGYLAFWDPSSHHWLDNQVFDLFVQRTYGGMNNETLLSIPFFVFMGYIIERAALVDKMFFSVQLAFRRLPASLAVTTLLVCAFWGIASGIVGAVVVLMGVIAMRPMLKAGYDVRLASGVITAGGTLGILIPPSVMLIVYAAVAGPSIVKFYAAAMLPGFFLTLLYLIYIVGWAMLNPKIAPTLPPDQYKVAVPEWIQHLQRGPSKRVMGGLLAAAFRPGTDFQIWKNLIAALIPLGLTGATFAGTWWYVTIHNAPPPAASAPAAWMDARAAAPAPDAAEKSAPPESAEAPPPEAPQELGSGEEKEPETEQKTEGPPEAMGIEASETDTALGKIPENFYAWFWAFAALCALVLGIYYWRMDGEQLEILKLLEESVVPLGVLTFIVLAVILFGITTASESAGVGALGAVYLAALAKYPRRAM